MIQRAALWGAQFHPEKSHRFGMTLLGSFARL
jgi:imidazoleglycerol phosphate synthase glutamine amidotransferase subunit HisH